MVCLVFTENGLAHIFLPAVSVEDILDDIVQHVDAQGYDTFSSTSGDVREQFRMTCL